jgi:hypothetical protein
MFRYPIRVEGQVNHPARTSWEERKLPTLSLTRTNSVQQRKNEEPQLAQRPYGRQYEKSSDPYPSTLKGKILWALFFMPGAILLWSQYMFPSRGSILVSRRRAENRILQMLLTLSIYCVIGAALIYLVANR